MKQFLISGPTQLHGEFTVVGSKNTVLAMMPAVLLATEPVTLHNVPRISDVDAMRAILELFGVMIDFHDHTMTMDASQAHYAPVPEAMARTMRASILVLGPALARFGRVSLPYPGGDYIGQRPIDAHIDVMRGLGCEVNLEHNTIEATGYPRGGDITVEAMSVTGTENAITLAVLAAGETTIRLAAVEPQVVALCEFLNLLGARIVGVGSNRLIVHGLGPKQHLHGGASTVIPDYLEAGTVAIAAAATRSELRIRQFWHTHNEALLSVFRKIGVDFTLEGEETLSIHPAGQLRALRVRTDVFPGLPSDLQAPMSVLLTQADGTSEIFETVFEGRLNYMHDLERLGANTFIRDVHTAVITGPTPLHGHEVVSIDIRAGATMVMAALLAEGQTTINDIEHIDRGYEALDERLNAIGARIERRVQ